jgi:hypothetical protein
LGSPKNGKLSPRWVELTGANLPIFLLADRPGMAQLGTKRCHAISDGIGYPVRLDFIVSNLDEMVGRLCGFGASLDRGHRPANTGASLKMADPFGNGLDMIEFSGPGYYDVKR